MGSSSWKYSEKLLADVLGIDRKVLRSARNDGLLYGGWSIHDKVVAYSASGLLRTLKLLEGLPKFTENTPHIFFGKELAAIQACCEIGGSLANGQGTERILQVVKRYKNHRMLEGTLNGQPQRICVRENANFQPGLWLPCELIEGDLWRFTGRCPSSFSDGRRRFRFRPGGPEEKEKTSMNELTEFDGKKRAEPRDGSEKKKRKRKKKGEGPAPDQLGEDAKKAAAAKDAAAAKE